MEVQLPTATRLTAEGPLAALVFAAGQVQAHRVVIAGVERVRDGVVTGLDPLVAARVRDAGTRLAQWRRCLLYTSPSPRD